MQTAFVVSTEVLQATLYMVVKYLDSETLSNILAVNKSIRSKASFLMTEWSLSEEDLIKKKFFSLYHQDKLLTGLLPQVEIYYDCQYLLDILESYAVSQTTLIRFSKKEICQIIKNMDLLETFIKIPKCPFLEKNIMITPYKTNEGKEFTLGNAITKATPLSTMYELFLVGYCAWFEDWNIADMHSNMVLKQMKPETIGWLLKQCLDNKIINALQKDTIETNITNTQM